MIIFFNQRVHLWRCTLKANDLSTNHIQLPFAAAEMPNTVSKVLQQRENIKEFCSVSTGSSETAALRLGCNPANTYRSEPEKLFTGVNLGPLGARLYRENLKTTQLKLLLLYLYQPYILYNILQVVVYRGTTSPSAHTRTTILSTSSVSSFDSCIDGKLFCIWGWFLCSFRGNRAGGDSKGTHLPVHWDIQWYKK